MMMPPRPKFYALIWAQFTGFLMIVLGMLPYWFGLGDAVVPSVVTWRIAAITVIVLGMVMIPLVRNTQSVVADMEVEDLRNEPDPLADDPRKVRRLIWWYCYLDLGLLTYLVHTTGGITGSMFAGTYLLLPALALLLILDASDIGKALLLTSLCAVGILGATAMSHYDKVEFDAAKYKHAFDISMGVVTVLGISIPLLQAVILKRKMKKQAQGRANTT